MRRFYDPDDFMSIGSGASSGHTPTLKYTHDQVFIGCPVDPSDRAALGINPPSVPTKF